MRKHIIIIISIVIALILGRFVISNWSKFSADKAKSKGMIPAVTVQTVKSANVVRQFEAPARVLAKYRVEVLARISGYLTKSYFKEGDYVKQGQVLFQIEPTEFKLYGREGKVKRCVYITRFGHSEQIERRSHKLKCKLLIRFKSLVFSFQQFTAVIYKTDKSVNRCKTQRESKRNKPFVFSFYEGIYRNGTHNDEYGENKRHTAHSRSSLFGLVPTWPYIEDLLSHLLTFKNGDQPFKQQNRYQKHTYK